MTVNIGDKIPAFEGATIKGKITAADLKGSKTVLFFYPKDNTPGCTLEACGFRDNLPKFKKANTVVYGISKDSLKSHDKFSSKYELPFPLISDEDGSICDAFGTWVEKSLYGRKYMGIERATYLIDEKGIIRHIWRKVKVAGHIDAVLSETRTLK